MADARTVLLVNPNTNRATTMLMADLARTYLEPASLTVEAITVEEGPAMIVDPSTLAESAAHVVRAVRRRLDRPAGEPVAAVIVAAIGDPGRERLAEELAVPVVGIGQASIFAAAGEGRMFGMATSTPLLADSLCGLVERHGKGDTFTGVRLTRSDPLTLAANPEQQYEELGEAVRACVQEDGAEAVIIAGGPLSHTARRLAGQGFAEIIEPLPSAGKFVINALPGICRHIPAVRGSTSAL